MPDDRNPNYWTTLDAPLRKEVLAYMVKEGWNRSTFMRECVKFTLANRPRGGKVDE